MTKRETLLEKARNNPKGLKFKELLSLAEQQGWAEARSEGSHFIYKRPGIPGIMDFQSGKSGVAKPYQVRQLLLAIDGLDEGEE